MSRVLVIGIDSLDSILLDRFEACLPNFKKLRGETPGIKSMEGVFPPDSPTSWASIYTGLNPAKHGILEFIDPLDRIATTTLKETDNSELRGKTFWDIASSRGKKVCVIIPLLGYPAWPVNGTMIGRSVLKQDFEVFPDIKYEKYPLPKLIAPRGFPGKGSRIQRYIEISRKNVMDEAEFALEVLEEEDWDLFFMYFGTLDAIQGFLWMYHDEHDPAYPGDNPYKNAIRDFYILYDEVVGKFLDSVDINTIVIVVSDHGMGMRPVKLLSINEVLKRQGYLTLRTNGSVLSSKALVNLAVCTIEKLKGQTLQFIYKHELGNVAQWLLRVFPSMRRIYTRPLTIDWQQTVAYLSDLSGIKAYSYGGIKIEKEHIKSTGIEELTEQIIEELSQIKEPDTGKNLVKWICRREDLYTGGYIEN